MMADGDAASEGSGSVFGAFPVLHFLLFLTAGIITGYVFSATFEAHALFFLIVACVLAAVLAVLLPERRRHVSAYLFYVVAAALFFSLGLSIVSVRLSYIDYRWASGRHVYTGVVMSPPSAHGKVVKARVLVSVHYDGHDVSRDHRVADISFMRSARDTMRVGDAVAFETEIVTPQNAGNPYEFDYASYLRVHGVSGTALVFKENYVVLSRSDADSVRKDCLGFFDRLAITGYKIQSALQGIYDKSGLNGNELAVLSAMTIGNKSMLSSDLRNSFSEVGVSHVLALSGLHLGIIYAMLQFLLTFWSGRSRMWHVAAQVVIVLSIWAFAVVAGLPLSLVRASVMYSLVSLAQIFGRSVFSLGNLYVAAFVMLLCSPLSLFDVGFQLSFLSVFFILKFVDVIAPRRVVSGNVLGKLWGLLAVSLCAQAGVAPLVAYYFHNFPLCFAFANIFVVPLATVVVSLGMAYLALSWAAPVTALVGTVLHWALALLLKAVNVMASLPFASLSVYPSLLTVVLVYAAVLFLMLCYDRRRLWLLMPAFAAMTAAFVFEMKSNYDEGDVAGVYFYKTSSPGVVHFVASAQESYLYSPRVYADSAVGKATASIARSFWERCSIARPRRLGTHVHTYSVKAASHLVCIGDRKVCIVDSGVPRHAVFRGPRVDAVYVARGYKGDLMPVVSALHAPLVVLDSHVTPWWRKQFAAACCKAHVKCYDLSSRPALKLDI